VCEQTQSCPWHAQLARLQQEANPPFESVHAFVQRCSPNTRSCACLSEWFGAHDVCSRPLSPAIWAAPSAACLSEYAARAPKDVVVGAGKLRRLPNGLHACAETLCSVHHARPAALPDADVWVDAATIDSIVPYLPQPGAHRHTLIAVHRDESHVRFPVLGARGESPAAAGYDLALSFHRGSPYGVDGGAHARSTYVERSEAQLAAPGLPWAAKSKEHVVTWFARNCEGTASARQALVAELMRHMRVHSYGGCMHTADSGVDAPAPCRPYGDSGSGGKGEEDKPCIMYHSLFYLALENTEEPGYVTEKLWDALAYGAVPVYFGAPDVAELLPTRNAAILASDFGSVAELAAHLQRVGADEALYEAHRAWKRAPSASWQPGFRAAVADGLHGLMCTLCDRVAAAG
jgi:hypothetical protein